jgi:hypothetical protein
VSNAQINLAIALRYAELAEKHRRRGLWTVARDYMAWSEERFSMACELEKAQQ